MLGEDKCQSKQTKELQAVKVYFSHLTTDREHMLLHHLPLYDFQSTKLYWQYSNPNFSIDVYTAQSTIVVTVNPIERKLCLPQTFSIKSHVGGRRRGNFFFPIEMHPVNRPSEVLSHTCLQTFCRLRS